MAIIIASDWEALIQAVHLSRQQAMACQGHKMPNPNCMLMQTISFWVRKEVYSSMHQLENVVNIGNVLNCCPSHQVDVPRTNGKGLTLPADAA